jgi:hypothetical protein
MQMMFPEPVNNLMTWSSQNPISRKRSATAGEAQSCLIRTAIPVFT